MNRITQLSLGALGTLSVATFGVLVVNVLWGVLTRYAFGNQAPWTEELARVLLVWLSMLGSALAYAYRSHLGVDVVVEAMAPPARDIAMGAVHALVLAFALGVMVYGGTTLFFERLDAGQVMSTLPVRKAWMYLATPVSGLLMGVFAVDALARVFGGRTGRPLGEPR